MLNLANGSRVETMPSGGGVKLKIRCNSSTDAMINECEYDDCC